MCTSPWPTTTSPRRRPVPVKSWAATVGLSTARAPRLVVLRVYDSDVPGETITTEVEAMSADASGTLPDLLDLATLDDGRCCLVVERLGGPALSRILAERTLSPGEAVTVLAPIVVAVAELARNGFVHARLAASDVLLDDAGRPRLVGLGALRRLPADGTERVALLRSGHAALAGLMEEVVAAVAPAGALSAPLAFLRERMDARPFEPCEAEVERRLFAAAAPEPVSGLRGTGSAAATARAGHRPAGGRCGPHRRAGLARPARSGDRCRIPPDARVGPGTRRSHRSSGGRGRRGSRRSRARAAARDPARSWPLAGIRRTGRRWDARRAAHPRAARDRRRPIARRRARRTHGGDAAAVRRSGGGDCLRIRRRRGGSVRLDRRRPRHGGPPAARTSRGVLRDARSRLPRVGRPAGVGDRGIRSAGVVRCSRGGADGRRPGSIRRRSR